MSRLFLPNIGGDNVAAPLDRVTAERCWAEAAEAATARSGRRYAYDDAAALARAHYSYPCLRDLNELAKALAVLHWLVDTEGVELPTLPASVSPQKAETPDVLSLRDVRREVETARLASPAGRPGGADGVTWWRAPSPDFQAVTLAEWSYRVLVGGEDIGSLRQVKQRVYYKGTPCVLWRQQMHTALDQFADSESYAIYYTSDGGKPLACSYRRTLTDHGKPISSQLYTVEPQGNKFHQHLETDGKVTLDQEVDAIPSEFRGFDGRIRALEARAGKADPIAVRSCPDNPMICASEVLTPVGWEELDLHGTRQRVMRMTVDRDRAESDPEALEQWQSAQLWVDGSGRISRQQIVIPMRNRSELDKAMAQRQATMNRLAGHPHMQELFRRGRYKPLAKAGTPAADRFASITVTLVRSDDGIAPIAATRSAGSFILADTVQAIPVDKPISGCPA